MTDISTTQTPPAKAKQAEEDRPLKPALLRGWRRKCPQCGSGPLFRGYLKLNQKCAVCDLDLTNARADDGPAYLTILLVGHLMAPIIHVVYTQFRPEPLVLATGLSVGCVALALFLLPRLKGGIVAFQWSRRMHGFGEDS
ncbi:DUF983 domain-containing protein [Alphaproteobacteria bacterium KMM 3653]|uniref:DUF983 domain-containing protein n=1 Tax=Harenicola maris TaxID=2841044 RepID=A0AAP2CQP8_9RHOB|nr:DUF983 domain-containing protein [Harenicola maris]